MNVLSLCDGMASALLALDRAGIEVEHYFSAEIKPMALKLQKHHYIDGKTDYKYLCTTFTQIGDVNKISYKNGTLTWENGEESVPIDLVCFGSPCQSFSRAMREERRIGLEDKVRSGLFLECARILKEVNPKYFLMENVVMKKEDENVITTMLGVNPVRINSSLVTAQLRDRLYWTNIPGVKIPSDKGIKLQDVIKDGYAPVEKARCLTACDSHGFYNGSNWKATSRFHRFWYKCFTTMIFPTEEDFRRVLEITEKVRNGRLSRAEFYDDCDPEPFKKARYLWKEEREQGFRQFRKTTLHLVLKWRVLICSGMDGL